MHARSLQAKSKIYVRKVFNQQAASPLIEGWSREVVLPCRLFGVAMRMPLPCKWKSAKCMSKSPHKMQARGREAQAVLMMEGKAWLEVIPLPQNIP